MEYGLYNSDSIWSDVEKDDNKSYHSMQMSIEKIVVSEGIEEIRGAFPATMNLKEVELPNSLIKITDTAFADCKSLNNITIPNSVTSIGYHAFSYCNKLKTVYFEHTTAPTFGSSCFYKSSGELTTFYFKNSTVASKFTTSYYNSKYGTKSTDYNW